MVGRTPGRQCLFSSPSSVALGRSRSVWVPTQNLNNKNITTLHYSTAKHTDCDRYNMCTQIDAGGRDRCR
jgi:hypothetical protein